MARGWLDNISASFKKGRGPSSPTGAGHDSSTSSTITSRDIRADVSPTAGTRQQHPLWGSSSKSPRRRSPRSNADLVRQAAPWGSRV
eukprot:jgi/Chrzof1/5951/Cz16g21210.t1